jgi:hypothetical protein
LDGIYYIYEILAHIKLLAHYQYTILTKRPQPYYHNEAIIEAGGRHTDAYKVIHVKRLLLVSMKLGHFSELIIFIGN